MTLASVTLMCPAAQQANANICAQLLGWGPNVFSVQLSDGTNTYYAAHGWFSPAEIKAIVQAVKNNTAPPLTGKLSDYGITAAQALTALKSITIDGALCRAGECFDHWAAAIAGKKLVTRDQQGNTITADVPAPTSPATVAQRQAEFSAA